MKTSCGLGCAFLLMVLANGAVGGGEDKLKTTARKVLADYKDAVISVKYAGFIAHQFDGKVDKQDFSGEATGTILSPNGLTALCLGSITGSQGGPPVVVAQGAKVSTAFTDFTFMFSDGSKMPAKLVFRDEKLGVLFAAPVAKQTKLKHVALEKRKAPELLDKLIALNRLPECLNREPEIGIGRVSAVLKMPHAALVSDFILDGGVAVFDSTGHPIGLGVVRDKIEDGTRMQGNPRLIVLPPEALNLGKHLEAIKLWEKDDK